MSAPICPRNDCGGWYGETDAFGDWTCLKCGHVIYLHTPLGIPEALKGRPTGSRTRGVAPRDKLRGNKPKPYSLAPNPGGA